MSKTVASDEAISSARAFFHKREKWRITEALPWVAAVAAFFIFPDYMALGTQIVIAIIFALSLDLILGYAGIVSLGHAAYFGAGAYATGMLSAHLGWGEPITLMLFGGLVGAALGFVSGWDIAALSRSHFVDADPGDRDLAHGRG